MLITSVAHLKRVLIYWDKLYKEDKETGRTRYIITDTETVPKPGFIRDDALVYDRANIKILAIGWRGQAYACATSILNSSFPTPFQYGEVLKPIWADKSICKVAHNFSYDAHVLRRESDLVMPVNCWCTLIGAWKGSEYLPKGLKERAFRYGRILRETKNVDFENLKDIAEYAEEDIRQTDELFQMQYFGSVIRQKHIQEIDKNGTICVRTQILPTDKKEMFIPEDEKLTPFDKKWMVMQELPYLRSTVRSQSRGMPMDVKKLRSIRSQLMKDRDAQLKVIYRFAGRPINIGSQKDLNAIFDKLGINNPHKTKTGKSSYNAKAVSKLKVSSGHPFLAALTQIKEINKLVSTYAGTIPVQFSLPHSQQTDSGLEYYLHSDTGAIHATINTVGAITGRNSCQNPNLHQIPARKDTYGFRDVFCGTAIHPTQIFVPRFCKKLVLIVLDYAQLELRVMCLLSRDPEMERILGDPKGDIHQNTADKFNIARDPYAKNINFLLLYGGEDYMLSESLSAVGAPTTQAQASAYRSTYNRIYCGVQGYRKQLLAHHQQHGFVRLWCGRKRQLMGIDWNNKYAIHKAETTLSNNVVQGSGQDLLKGSIVRLDTVNFNPDKVALECYRGSEDWRKRISDYSTRLEKFRRTLKLGACKFRLQIHDEAVFSAEPSAAEECMHICAEVMTWHHYIPSINSYNIPLVAEGGIGETWKQAKSKTENISHVKFFGKV